VEFPWQASNQISIPREQLDIETSVAVLECGDELPLSIPSIFRSNGIKNPAVSEPAGFGRVQAVVVRSRTIAVRAGGIQSVLVTSSKLA
jgi:hypothetical protein